MKIITKSATMARFTLSVLLAVCATVAWVLPANATGNINNVRGEDVFDNGVFIGDEQSTGTSYYMPVNVYYNYSLIQQIYTPEEIGMAGTITSLAFDYTYSEAFSMEGVKVYMKEVYKEEFSSGLDLVAVGDDDLVFEGTFEADGAGWVTINLDTPFTYNGEGNLLVCFYDPTDGYPGSAYKFRTTPTEQYLAAGQYSDSNVPDPANPGNFNGSKGFWQYRTNIVIGITPSSDIIVTMPSSLEATEVNGHDVTLAWDGGTELYNLEYRKKTDEQWTSVLTNSTLKTHTLTGLAADTEYQVRVQSVGEQYATSAWRTISFTTPVAVIAPTNVIVTLTPGNGTVATIDWTENGEATEWLIQYKPSNAQTFQDVSTTEKPFTLTGLTPETEYTVQVAAWNADKTESSSPSPAVTFTPTNAYMITVNDGTATNSRVPIYSLYAEKNTMSQFIIPNEDLEVLTNGYIYELKFYASKDNVNWGNAVFKVYLGEVDATTFASASDAYDLGNLQNVFEGSLAITSNEMTVTFDNPYQYLGGNLLIAFDQTEVGIWISLDWYGVNTGKNTAIGGYQSSIGTLQFLPKMEIWFQPGNAPTCFKPTKLSVSEITDNSAVVSWTSDEPAWDLMVNDEVIENVTNPYTLTNLQSETNYEVKVRAKNNNGTITSDWTSPYNFMTKIAGEKCFVTLDLVDSYGDGWNGNAIQVVDALTGYIFGTATIEKLTSELIYKTASVDIEVVAGREVNFVWVKGSYPDECSFTITSPDEEVIAEIAKGDASNWANGYVIATYTVDCHVSGLRTPTDLAVSEIGPRSAVLDWTENGEATKWVVSVSIGDEEAFQTNATEKPFTITRLTPETEYSVKVRPYDEEIIKWSQPVTFTTKTANPTPENLAVNDIAPTSAVVTWEGVANSYDLQYAEFEPVAITPGDRDVNNDGDWYYYDNGNNTDGISASSGSSFYAAIMLPAGSTTGNILTTVSIYDYAATSGTIYIYNNGDTAPAGEAIAETEFELTESKGFVEFSMGEVPFDISENLWIVVYSEAGGAIGTSQDNGDANGRWVSIDGTAWEDLASIGINEAFMIRAQVTDNFDFDALTWITVNNATSPYTLQGLERGTKYAVRVKGNYDEGLTSKWAMKIFTTPDTTPAPSDVAATMEGRTATVSWQGLGDTYTVRYRKAVFGDDFEKGLDKWTNIDGDGDGHTWETLENFGLDGGYAATSASFIDGVGVLTPDNLLISPLVTLGGTVAFYAMPRLQSYPSEVFGVFVSTEGTDPDNFSVVETWTMTTGNWRIFTADLSNFEGEGYVAIRHYDCSDWYALNIDNVLVLPQETKNCWTTATTTEKSINLTGLEPESGYMVQVQATYGDETSDWTTALFVMPEYSIPTAITEISESEGNGNWYSIDGKKLNDRPKAKGLYIRNGQKVVVK